MKTEIKYNVGDWVFIIGAHNINELYFMKHYPRGLFGRIIEIQVRYSPLNGKRKQDTIMVRVYRPNAEKWHSKTYYKYLTPYKP